MQPAVSVPTVTHEFLSHRGHRPAEGGAGKWHEEANVGADFPTRQPPPHSETTQTRTLVTTHPPIPVWASRECFLEPSGGEAVGPCYKGTHCCGSPHLGCGTWGTGKGKTLRRKGGSLVAWWPRDRWFSPTPGSSQSLAGCVPGTELFGFSLDWLDRKFTHMTAGPPGFPPLS